MRPVSPRGSLVALAVQHLDAQLLGAGTHDRGLLGQEGEHRHAGVVGLEGAARVDAAAATRAAEAEVRSRDGRELALKVFGVNRGAIALYEGLRLRGHQPADEQAGPSRTEAPGALSARLGSATW